MNDSNTANVGQAPVSPGREHVAKSDINKRIEFHAAEHIKLLKWGGLNDESILKMCENCFQVGAGKAVTIPRVPDLEGRDEWVAKAIDGLWAVQAFEYMPREAPETPEEMETVARTLVLMKRSFAAGYCCGLAGAIALKNCVIFDDLAKGDFANALTIPNWDCWNW